MSLDIQSLAVGYGNSMVIRNLSMSLADGESLSILGLNGVGKTTLLNALMGLLKTKSGSITLDDVDISSFAADRRVRQGLAYVPQGRSGFGELTVLENLKVIQECSPGVPPSAIDEAIEIFPRLKPLLKRRAGVLSGGQQQQLSIARALTTKPSLLLLDEPTEGIQPSIIDEIEQALVALRANDDLQIVLVEQFIDFALRLTDRYIVIEGGSITQSGSSAELSADQTRELLAI